ncbi:cell wall-binding repeat-containing protein [Bacillus salacetis]|uniref:cell wall-binding repeat-containing protein n=1 Tax=Bacillus salacetis TaxID=2315464 RepID=UPI003BA0BDDF
MFTRKVFSILLLVLVSLAYPFTISKAEDQVKLIVKYKNDGEVSALSVDNEDDSIDVLSVPSSKAEEVIYNLQKQPNVEYVERDRLVHVLENTTSEAYQESQQQIAAAIHNDEAMKRFSPKSSITVAVVDSGVDLDHPDLEPYLIEGKNFIDESQPPSDLNGHGTHVAGLINSFSGNSKTETVHKVNLMPIKVFDDNTGYMSTIIKGIYYAVDHGADVINLSLGSYYTMRSLQEAIDYAVSNDVLLVSAAGNDYDDTVMFPAAYEDVLGVASIDTKTFEKAPFSNYGFQVSVAAPGTNIYSTWIDGYKAMEGTSMSTAIASSLGVMLRQQAPYLTGLQVKRIIEQSAVPLQSEYDLGHGTINALNALDTIENNNRLSGITSVETSVEISKNNWDELSERSITWKNNRISGRFIILASGDKFPDSLAASPLSSYLDSPILLVKKHTLSERVKEEISRLNADSVIIIGGESAISGEVDSELKEINLKTIRVSGINRYETAVEVNKLIPYSTDKVFVASGENYPDALSVAAYSGSYQYPVLFVKKNEVSDKVAHYIKDHQVSKVYLIGGQNVLSDSITTDIPNSERVAGADRYETNYLVHSKFDKSNTARDLIFATGENFPDALTASGMASKTGSPIILVKENKLPVIKKAIESYPERQGYHILGGPQAISLEMAWNLDKLVYNAN